MSMARTSRIWRTILLTIVIFSLSLPTYAKYSGGTGEPNDPYQIATAEDLIAIGETPEDYDKHFILTGDIDLDPNLPGRKVFDKAVIAPASHVQEYPYYVPGRPFRGVLDGNTHVISNLTISGMSYLGLFGRLDSGSEVRNINVANVNITGLGDFTGGLAGANEGTVIGCSKTGIVKTESSDCVGGLLGDNGGYVTECYSHGLTIGIDHIGGLAGSNWGTVTLSSSAGVVSGRHNSGGLVGSNGGEISQCQSTCTVSITRMAAGGLLGLNGGKVNQCTSSGSVSGERWVGGLVGYNEGGDISQCSSTSTVSGSDSCIGGLVGNTLVGTISQCYSVGSVKGSKCVGGLVGYSGCFEFSWLELISCPDISDCFWDIETSGQSTSGGGTGKTTAEMKTASTFLDAGWDFVGETTNGTEDIWKISEGLGYPRLWWEKYNGGTGDPNDPYQIATAEDLIALGETPEDYDKHFILTADIDLDPNLPGRKVFDRAVIAPDVDPDDEFFTLGGTPFTGFSFVGTFDGNSHRISHLTTKGMGYLGLFGKLTSNAEIMNLGVLDVSITGSRDFVGGLVGLNHGGTVMQCYGSGIVSGDWCVGGLVGRNYTGNITESYTTGIVSGNHWIGGLAGDSGGSVSNCYSMAVVSGIDGVGGLVGYVWHTISRCYSAGFVSGEHNVGGLFGETNVAYAYIVSCFWDIQTSGQATSYGGTGLTTEKMQNADTFFAWGVCGGGGVWTINEGADYPRLHWENQPGKDISNAPLSRLLMGTGGEDDPFLIHTPEQLYLIGLFPCEWDKHFKLMADIDLSEYDGKNGHLAFNIIGRSYDSPFTGIFDGNGHKISDLTITGNYSVGLFGHLFPGAEVRNLGVVDVNITGIEDYVGGLVGQNGGSVKQCYSTGTVCGRTYVGGLMGYTGGIVEQSYSTCMVRANYHPAGGLAGGNTGEVIHCYSTGPTSDVYGGGGLIGSNCGEVIMPPICGSITNCFWDIQTSGQITSDGGTGKTTAEMQTASTFLEAGWDFVGETANGTDDIWWILEGQDYPRLWWEAR